MAVGGSTRHKRRLGRYMRPFVEAASKLDAERLPSRQTITRLLAGENLPQWKNFTALLDQLDVTPEQYKRAIELYVVAGQSTDAAVIAHARDLPTSYTRFRADEADARGVCTLDPMFFPGLLQTAEYAEAAARCFHRTITGTPWNEVAAAERLDRQALLDRDPNPLELHALIDEAVLHRWVGGAHVMRNQLDHVIEASARDNITVKIIRGRAGAYGTNSALTLLTFPDDPELPEPDAGFVEVTTPDLQSALQSVNEGEPTTVLSAVWHDAAAVALSPSDSVRFLEEVRDTQKGES